MATGKMLPLIGLASQTPRPFLPPPTAHHAAAVRNEGGAICRRGGVLRAAGRAEAAHGSAPPVPSRRGSHTENGIHVFLHSILAMLGVLLGIDFHVKEFLQLDNVFPFLIAII